MDKNYWNSPRGILHRACARANPYKTPAAQAKFANGWREAADEQEKLTSANAYSIGWNARIEYEKGVKNG